MAAIPRHHQALADAIYRAYELEEHGPIMLTRIGASGIGEECLRAVWYGWRGYYNDLPQGRMLRLFRTGYIQEDRIVADLKKANLQVWEIDPETGKQWVYTFAQGHGVCKTDGVVKGVPGAEKTPHVLEIKSSNDKGFKELQNYGVQKAKPMHYYQMHAGMLGSGLDRALYIAINKNDESLYIERVVRDEKAIKFISDRYDSLVSSNLPPPRITEKEDDWRCKFCDAKEICWGKAEPPQHCRTCSSAQIAPEGNWACGRMGGIIISYKDQHKGCDLWTKL